MRVLGIESSCDETAAAVYDGSTGLLSNVIASQVAVHGAYGGVVPELASREHLKSIVPVVERALSDASTAREAIAGHVLLVKGERSPLAELAANIL